MNPISYTIILPILIPQLLAFYEYYTNIQHERECVCVLEKNNMVWVPVYNVGDVIFIEIYMKIPNSAQITFELNHFSVNWELLKTKQAKQFLNTLFVWTIKKYSWPITGATV